MEESRLAQLERSIEEIKQTQEKIALALLGSYDKQSIGLIEESRTQRREINLLSDTCKLQDKQIEELTEFRKDIKKIVAVIAIIVPFIFEVLKVGWVSVWEFLKQK